MKKFIAVLLALSFIIFCLPKSEAHYQKPSEPVVKSKPNLNDIILAKATQYKVSPKIMSKVIQCESKGNRRAIGDSGKSFGLVQIHLPSHPKITKEQAFDQEFAIDFLAKNLAKGNGRMWTCYRNLV